MAGRAYIPDQFIDPKTGKTTDVARRFLESVGAAIAPGAASEVLTSDGSAFVWRFLTNVNIAAGAAIAWSKISKSGSSLADLATRSASDLSSGTLPDARFPATLPAASGVNLTALNATNLASGTVAAARLPQIVRSVVSMAAGVVAAAATVYLGLGAESATESVVRIVMPVAGVLRNLTVVTDGAPGAAKTYIYTVRVNGADTTLTCTVSGAVATTASDTTHSATVAAGDTVTVKLVTLAAAATQRHSVSLSLESA